MAVCYIAGAAPGAERIAPRPGDFLIAADGGLAHLLRWGLRADLAIGDFDSLEAIPAGVPREAYPRAKDDTDLSLALDRAIALEYRHVIITGAWGGRPDHAVGNIQLLVKAARRGVFAQMLCGGFIATAVIDNTALRLRGHGTVSVFACGGQAAGVTIRGLEYPLDNAILLDDTPLGVSNVLVGEGVAGEGTISLAQGTLLVFYEEGIKCDIA
ncbi:MAG: thiamine diphosphokinase [Oscillospiraceae bacterium]|nr:thiamine diphosphokinase [Oscillospiraceae bacterium]